MSPKRGPAAVVLHRSMVALCLSLALSCSLAASPKPPNGGEARDCPTVARAIPLTPAQAEEISVEQLALLLPKHPVVVGFDVDDTLVFSTPAFDALQPSYDPNVIRPKRYEDLSAEQKAKFHEFWNRLNDEADDRSIPKKIGKRLLELHHARGDTIYLISRRQSSVPDTGKPTRRYQRMFGVAFAAPVVQTDLRDKTRFLCERRIEYYYGDSDSDVTASVTAGAVPIRVKRASDSYAKDPAHNGELGEIVIRDSER